MPAFILYRLTDFTEQTFLRRKNPYLAKTNNVDKVSSAQREQKGNALL